MRADSNLSSCRSTSPIHLAIRLRTPGPAPPSYLRLRHWHLLHQFHREPHQQIDHPRPKEAEVYRLHRLAHSPLHPPTPHNSEQLVSTLRSVSRNPSRDLPNRQQQLINPSLALVSVGVSTPWVVSDLATPRTPQHRPKRNVQVRRSISHAPHSKLHRTFVSPIRTFPLPSPISVSVSVSRLPSPVSRLPFWSLSLTPLTSMIPSRCNSLRTNRCILPRKRIHIPSHIDSEEGHQRSSGILTFSHPPGYSRHCQPTGPLRQRAASTGP